MNALASSFGPRSSNASPGKMTLTGPNNLRSILALPTRNSFDVTIIRGALNTSTRVIREAASNPEVIPATSLIGNQTPYKKTAKNGARANVPFDGNTLSR